MGFAKEKVCLLFIFLFFLSIYQFTNFRIKLPEDTNIFYANIKYLAKVHKALQQPSEYNAALEKMPPNPVGQISLPS
jgi:hypothetical protein